jgi:selenocysteine lyase/cysteine desulfurase
MRVLTEREGNYFFVEIYIDDNRLLIRVGFDHEPTEEEVDALLQSVSGGDDEVWQP